MAKEPATCRGKISYANQRLASIARTSIIQRKDRGPGDTGEVNIYACAVCGGFHIGHARRRIGSRPKRGGDRVRQKLSRYLELAGE